jgi:hypothetical protein
VSARKLRNAGLKIVSVASREGSDYDISFGAISGSLSVKSDYGNKVRANR